MGGIVAGVMPDVGVRDEVCGSPMVVVMSLALSVIMVVSFALSVIMVMGFPFGVVMIVGFPFGVVMVVSFALSVVMIMVVTFAHQRVSDCRFKTQQL